MPNSFAQTTELTCPECHQPFTADVWLIVDTGERSDLVEQICAGTLHDVTCLYCGNSAPLDAPLLIYTPDQLAVTRPPLIFSSSSTISLEQNQQYARQLLDWLRYTLGDHWQAAWLANGLPVMSRDQLSALLSHNSEEATTLDRPREAMQSSSGNSSDIQSEFEALIRRQEEGENNPQLWLQIIQEWEEFLAQPEVVQAPLLCAMGQGNLANVYLRLHEITGTEIWVSRGETLLTGMLTVFTHAEYPEQWANVHYNLGTLYIHRYERTDNEADALSTDEHYHNALEEYQQEVAPAQWARTHHNLGNLYILRYERTGDQGYAYTADQYYRNALEVCRREVVPAQWAETHQNLGLLYFRRYERTGDEAHAHTAVQHYHNALEMHRQEVAPVQWAETQHNLGNLYAVHYERTGDEAHARTAAQHYCNALKVRTRKAAPTDWAATQHSLGNLYARHYERSDDETHAHTAVQHYYSALEEDRLEVAPFNWASTQRSLGDLYALRYERNRDETYARAADQHFRNALEVRRREVAPAQWALTEHSLGNLYLSRYQYTANEEYARAADEHYHNALEVRKREVAPTDWALTQRSLGSLYLSRYERSGNETHARSADEHYHNALEEYQRGVAPTEWAMTQDSLGRLYFHLYQRSGNDDHARNADQYYCNALEVRRQEIAPAQWAATQHSLGNLYAFRYERSSDAIYARTADQHYRNVLAAADQYFLPSTYPFYAAAALSRLLFNQRRWQEASTAYAQADIAFQSFYTMQVYRESKETWLGEAQGLHARSAYALAQNGKYEKAVATLEVDRARLLAETLEQNRRDLGGLPALGHATLLERYCQAAAQLQALQQPVMSSSSTSSTEADLIAPLTAARADLNAAIAAIRQIPGYEDFFTQPTFVQIQAAAQHTPLIYLLTTSVGGLALIVYGERIIPVWLLLTEPALRNLLVEWFEAHYNFLRSRQPAAFQQWLDIIDRITHRLWEEVIGSLAVALHTLASPPSREQEPTDKAMPVTLIPTGLLSLLPLHAAWTEGEKAGDRRYFLDEFVVNYAPSARVLAYARQSANDVMSTHLLAVDEPKPVCGNAMPNSAAEVAAIADHFAQPRLFAHEQATRAAVLAALPQAQVAHFSCHGATNWDNALDSGLVMAHDEMLTVRDLLELQLPGARLATLSACETGIVGTNLPDEVVALPSALVQAGFAGVAASLWSVADISTAMLMARFYDFWQADKLEPAQALRAAQRWVRDTTNREKRHYFEEKMFEASSATRMPEMVAADFLSAALTLHQDERSFEHPYWWAAFYLTGV